VIYPDANITKGELFAYHEAVGALMLEWAANRPLSLVRCPQGRAKKCFFQKHNTGSFGPSVHQIAITEGKGTVEDYVYVQDTAGILACVQMGTIEIHGWGSTTQDVEKPDRLIFDLDPDEGLGFAEVRRAATDMRQILADMGLQSFATAGARTRNRAGARGTRRLHQPAPAGGSAGAGRQDRRGGAGAARRGGGRGRLEPAPQP
jgi:bifunctional non-homologous end joining protein LigD